jgi:hypothetical protein
MFARASLVALVLASPAWADPDYPTGLFERSPLNDTPPAASRPGHKFPRTESAPAAAATIIASGAIHGRNHAEPIVHPHILGESGRLPPRRVARSPIVKALPSRRAMRAWSSDMKIGPRTYSRSLQCSAHRVCSIFVLSEPGGNRSKLASTSD